jgi:hypothetical protein
VSAHHSLPTKCTPWFTSVIEQISLWFYKCLPVTISLYSVLVLVNLTKYPMWCPFILTHVVILLRVTSCTHPVWSIQEDVISTCDKARFNLEVSHQWKLSPMAWNLINAISIRSIRWRCQTNGSEWVVQHDRGLQSTLSPAHQRKSCMRDWEVLVILTIPISSFPHN